MAAYQSGEVTLMTLVPIPITKHTSPVFILYMIWSHLLINYEEFYTLIISQSRH